jgi:tetratricopeptide (TPR) repeat protein
MFFYQLGYTYSSLLQYDKAIPAYEQALRIYKNWETKPYWIYQYTALAEAYIKTGQFEKAFELLMKAEEDFPGENSVNYFAAICFLSLNDKVSAGKYLDRYLATLRGNSVPEQRIYFYLGNIYEHAGMKDMAEEYYRKAYALDPDDTYILNGLGYFLADNNRNVDEGVELLTKALEIAPEDYMLMDSKGWALYKQGKTKEALVLIEKSNSLRPVYNHDIYLHLQEVRNALKTK